MARIDDISNIELVIHQGHRLTPAALYATMTAQFQEPPQDAIATDLLAYANRSKGK